jgi:hypothetical protein
MMAIYAKSLYLGMPCPIFVVAVALQIIAGRIVLTV